MNVAVIGCGTMGSGIAQIAATKGCKTYLYDLHSDALENSKTKLINMNHFIVLLINLGVELIVV